MSVIEIIGGILMILMSIFICIFVLMQQGSKGGGIAALSGGQVDSFLERNPGRGRDRLLYRATRACAIVFFILTIIVHAASIYLR